MAPKRKAADQQEDATNDGPKDDKKETAPVDRRAQMEQIARKRAAHFARFGGDDDDEDGAEGAEANVHTGGKDARSLGPWSSAAELAENRAAAQEKRQEKLRRLEEARERGGAGGDGEAAMALAALEEEGAELDAGAELTWRPRRDPRRGPRHMREVASLFDRCSLLVADLIEDVPTLEGVPDGIKSRIASDVCRRRKLTPEVVHLFAEAAPSELVLQDCTTLEPAVLSDLLKSCATARLQRLELHRCGRGLTDAVAEGVRTAVGAGGGQGMAACSTSSLKTLSLLGAYKISDQGAEALLSCCPSLTALSVEQCNRITDRLLAQIPLLLGPTLTSLNLAYCTGLSAAALGGMLEGLPNLEHLSLEGVVEVDDGVLGKAAAHCPKLVTLNISRCSKVTDAGVSTAASGLAKLESVSISEIPRLSDKSLGALALAPELHTLHARRCHRFSDAAVSAVCSMGRIRHISLSSNDKVANRTANALATCCHESLLSCDLSFCRFMSDNALGLIVDSCTHLRELRVYGCAQITSKFLDGHSKDNLVVLR